MRSQMRGLRRKEKAMARKGENIRKRKDGRWEARYIKGRNPNGTIQYGYVYAAKYSEVKEKRNETMQRLHLEPPQNAARGTAMTFHECFINWRLEIRHSLKSGSYFYYEVLIEHHLEPYFGKLQVGQLTSDLVQNFIKQKLDEGLSPSYIHSIIILFQGILKFTQRKNNLQLPSLYYQLPRLPHREPDIFSLQEWQKLDHYLERQTDSFAFGLRLCMYTGIRVGELSGLRWGDIDTASGSLSIRRTIYRARNNHYDGFHDTARTKLYMESPKTPSSIREIPLPYFLAEELPLRSQSTETFLLTGTEKCMEPRNIQKRYKKILERCNLRYLNFHSLRHSFATLGIKKGFDFKTLSEILGHASVSTTLNIYVHSDIAQKQHCMNLLET